MRFLIPLLTVACAPDPTGSEPLADDKAADKTCVEEFNVYDLFTLSPGESHDTEFLINLSPWNMRFQNIGVNTASCRDGDLVSATHLTTRDDVWVRIYTVAPDGSEALIREGDSWDYGDVYLNAPPDTVSVVVETTLSTSHRGDLNLLVFSNG